MNSPEYQVSSIIFDSSIVLGYLDSCHPFPRRFAAKKRELE